MKRIDPAKVAKFFAENRHTKPVQSWFVAFSEQGHIASCCGLTARVLAENPDADLQDINGLDYRSGALVIANLLALPVDYTIGFLNGWDNAGTDNGSPPYNRGIRAGQKAWKLTQEALS